MTAAVLKRGAPPVRRPPQRSRKPAPPPVPTVRLPLAPNRFRRHVLTGFATLIAVAAIVVVILLGYPARWWQSTAEAASRAGFEVRHVELRGVANSPRLNLYTAALEGPTNSMLLVDLAEVRARLRALPWVADASVTRRLPDTLIVDIVERQPAALWQFRQRVVAIDQTGRPLTVDNLDRFAKLPLVVGPDANANVRPLLALLADYPRLGGVVTAATYVGHRRWDLRFKSGETVSLPEGEAAARAALARFDGLDRTSGLLGKGFVRFDLRLPGRMTVRVAEPVKAAPPPKALKI